MYDVCVIGAGPGGYVAAIKAAQLGAKVALIEKDLLGGTCLNRGCIPTKALTYAAGLFSEIKVSPEIGIKVNSPELDLKATMSWKDRTVAGLRGGIEHLLKAQKIDFIQARAEIVDANKVRAGDSVIEAKNIVIATGSRPNDLAFLRFDSKNILSSRDILSLEKLPSSLLIIGGGVIGCEFASIFAAFGTKVTIVEMLPQLLPGIDKELAKRLEALFRKTGIEVLTGALVQEVKYETGGLKAVTNTQKHLQAEKILLCIGRSANIENLGIDRLGIKTRDSNIIVDVCLRTNISNIYAIGDVVGRYWLAHVASFEAVACAHNMMGQERVVDYSAVPSCIFTRPEIATVGLSEDDAKKSGMDVKIGKFPFQALGRARLCNQAEGFAKIVADASNDRVLGAQIIGPHASDIISELVLAINMKATVSDIEKTIHAHPTFPEAIQEAAASIFKRAIHIP